MKISKAQYIVAFRPAAEDILNKLEEKGSIICVDREDAVIAVIAGYMLVHQMATGQAE